jgi:hypothetical protein
MDCDEHFELFYSSFLLKFKARELRMAVVIFRVLQESKEVMEHVDTSTKAFK